MFEIKISPVMEECWQLEDQVYQLDARCIELEGVISSLGSLSGMEDCILRLKAQLSNMQGQHEVLRQMMQALNKTVVSYTGYESKICDNAEQDAIHYGRRRIEINDLSEIVFMMQTIFN